MTSADAMRASDGDREIVVQALQEQVGEGRLTLAEFEQRTEQAYQAKTVADLRALTRDLPIEPLGPTEADAHAWQQPFPMPAIPPWAQRTFPANHPFRRGRQLPARRVNPLGVAAVMLLTLFLVQGLVAAVAFGAHFVFPFLPILFVAMILLRRNGRRYYR